MPTASTRIFRVSLRPKLYRDLEIQSDKSLYQLAESIVRAFGFDFDHAFGFYSKLTDYYHDSPSKYELFADLENGDSDARSVKRTKIVQAFPTVDTKMMFLFDYGDEWRFKVELVGLGEKAPNARYPKTLASVGQAPPQYPDPDEDA